MEHATKVTACSSGKITIKCEITMSFFVNLLIDYFTQAKEYVARHEGALQERFAMSRSTKDLWARFKILLAAVSI